MYEPTFKFYDHSLVDAIVRDRDVTCYDFFRLLALCHTVMPDDKNGLFTHTFIQFFQPLKIVDKKNPIRLLINS